MIHNYRSSGSNLVASTGEVADCELTTSVLAVATASTKPQSKRIRQLVSVSHFALPC